MLAPRALFSPLFVFSLLSFSVCLPLFLYPKYARFCAKGVVELWMRVRNGHSVRVDCSWGVCAKGIDPAGGRSKVGSGDVKEKIVGFNEDSITQ